MAHKLIGYFTSKEEIIDKRIFGQVSEITLWGSATYKIGDSNNATKFAFIAYPISGSGSEREYNVFLWCNATSTSNSSNYVQYYRIYQGSITELNRETISFNLANSHGYRPSPMGIPMAGTILLDSNNLPILRDDNNVVNVYDGDAPSGLEDPAFLAFVDAVFDHPAVPPKGQGTVTLEIPANGANLTSTSALLGVSVTKMISKDDVVNIEGEPPVEVGWEVLFEYQFGSSSGYALINSLLEAHDFGKSGSPTWDIEGDLIKCVGQTLSALKAIDGRTGNSGSFPSSFSSYNIDDVISSSFSGAYERITVVKKGSVALPFEVGFHWQVGASGQAALLKSDGSFVTWSQIYYQGTGGNYITMGQSNNWSNIAFSGTIKVYEFFPSNGESDNGSWQTYDGSVAQSHSMTGCFIVFAIPN